MTELADLLSRIGPVVRRLPGKRSIRGRTSLPVRARRRRADPRRRHDSRRTHRAPRVGQVAHLDRPGRRRDAARDRPLSLVDGMTTSSVHQDVGVDAGSEHRVAVLGRALCLEHPTVGWNVVEGVVALAAVIAAGEILYGFWRSLTDKAVAAFLDFGIREHGFARVRCGTCRGEFLVAYSCKGRGRGSSSGRAGGWRPGSSPGGVDATGGADPIVSAPRRWWRAAAPLGTAR